jgi:hypothetical protein
MHDDFRARRDGQRRAAHDPGEIGDGLLQLERLARRGALLVPKRDLPARADGEQMPALADGLCAPREMLGPHRAGVVLDEHLALGGVPQLPFAVPAGGGEGCTVGPPRDGVATFLVRFLEQMQRLTRRRVVDRDLAGHRADGESRAIR